MAISEGATNVQVIDLQTGDTVARDRPEEQHFATFTFSNTTSKLERGARPRNQALTPQDGNPCIRSDVDRVYVRTTQSKDVWVLDFSADVFRTGGSSPCSVVT